MNIDTTSSFALPLHAGTPTADSKSRVGGDAFEVTISDRGVEVSSSSPSSAPAQSAPSEIEATQAEPAVVNGDASPEESATVPDRAAATSVVYDTRGKMGQAPSSRPGQILDLTG